MGRGPALLYHDVDEVLARKAWRRLRRQSMGVMTKPFPLTEPRRAPSTYIVMGEDRSINPVKSRRCAKLALAAHLAELPGGHSPFYSRPSALVEVLTAI